MKSSNAIIAKKFKDGFINELFFLTTLESTCHPKPEVFLPLFLFINLTSPLVKASSDLAAWSLNSNGVLELRTKSYSKLKAYFQRGDKQYGD